MALAETEATNRNYESAYLNQKRYVACVDSVYQLQRKSSLAETEQIYNYIKYQKENERLNAIQHNAITIGGITLGSFLLLIFVVVWKRWKKKLDLSNAEETVETLRKMEKENQTLSDCSGEEKDKMVKKALLMQLNIAKVLAQLDESSDEDRTFLEEFNRLFYKGQHTIGIDWNEFYSLVDLLYDDFANKLQDRYGKILLEKEIQLCCLLKANIDTSEIACIMGQSIYTVVHERLIYGKN